MIGIDLNSDHSVSRPRLAVGLDGAGFSIQSKLEATEAEAADGSQTQSIHASTEVYIPGSQVPIT